MSDKAIEVRKRIMKRVHALLQKTTDNGASEQEALSAVALAARLMAEHDLTLEQITETAENPLGEQKHDLENQHEVRLCAIGIERLTGTQYFYQKSLVTFFGFKRDAEIAVAMLKMLRNAMDAELKKWRDGDHYKRLVAMNYAPLALRKSFMKAMAIRITDRLNTMATEKEARMAEAGKSTVGGEDGEAVEVEGGARGTALVVQKQKIVEEAFGAAYDNIKTAKPINVNKDNLHAMRAGWEAGGRVGIGGIGDAESTLKIEG